jgi:hypothetical protein
MAALVLTTFAEVYRKLELPMSEAFRDVLSHESRREKKHRRTFAYSLEEFGLESNEIRAQLGDLFERFGWDEHGDPEAASPLG